MRRDISMFGLNAGYCATPIYDGLKAAETALRATGYDNVKSIWVPRNCPTGISGKTCQSTGTNCSLHNYGIPFDIDPYGHGNPHFQKAFGNGWNFSNCKVTRPQVEAVESIKNTNGETYFRWLGWAIGDTMHFEPQVPPSRTQVDWSTVPGGKMADHSHKPMPAELPRDWADETWKVWVARSGTDTKSRSWTFYREDLSWVYGRVIFPLEQENKRQAAQIGGLEDQIAALKKKVVALESAPSGSGGLTEAQVVALIERARLNVT